MPFGKYERRMMRFEDGTPMVAGRPSDSKRAIELVFEANDRPEGKTPGALADKVWADLERLLNEECGPYTAIGYPVAPTPENPALIILVDTDGNKVGCLESGDSFMHPSAFSQEAFDEEETE